MPFEAILYEVDHPQQHRREQKIQKFLQPLVGKPIDTKMLDTYLTRLTGVGRFESASYGLTHLPLHG